MLPLSINGDGRNTPPFLMMLKYGDLAKIVQAFLNTRDSIRFVESELKSYPVFTLWMPYSLPCTDRYSS